MKKIYYLIAMAFMAITFTSCEDVPESYGKPVSPIIPYEPAGTGAETDPFNVAGAIEKCKEIGTKASTEKFYIKGYAAASAEVDGGKVTFTMSDSKEGKGKKFTAYKVAGSDNKSLPSDFAVSVGEEIVLYGPMYHYNKQTPETATGAYIVTVNGEKTGSNTPGGDTDKGTEDKPFDVASAISAGDMTGVYLKGYIVGSAYYNGDAKQNEFNFGTTNAQASNLLLAATATETDASKCMPIALPNGALRTALNIKDNADNIGKEVLLYGNLIKYFGQPGMKETSYAVLDGTAIGTKPGGGDTPSGEVKTVTVSQFLAAPESETEWYQLTGTVTHLEDGTYNNSTQYGNFDLVDETGSIYVYGVVAEKGGTKGKFADLMTAKGIKDGSKITIIGNRGAYKGNAQVTNAYFVSVESGESGGGDTGGGGASFSAGKYFITYKSGDTYYVAKPLDEASVTKGYGYSYCAETTATDGKLNNVDASNLFTFTAITGGFSIQDANNVYYYTNATNKSFQVSTTAPADFYWTVTLGAGGTAKINSSAKTDYNIVHTIYTNKTTQEQTHEFIPSNTGDEIILAKEDGTLLK